MQAPPPLDSCSGGERGQVDTTHGMSCNTLQQLYTYQSIEMNECTVLVHAQVMHHEPWTVTAGVLFPIGTLYPTHLTTHTHSIISTHRHNVPVVIARSLKRVNRDHFLSFTGLPTSCCDLLQQFGKSFSTLNYFSSVRTLSSV